jgi:hypothetical protein
MDKIKMIKYGFDMKWVPIPFDKSFGHDWFRHGTIVVEILLEKDVEPSRIGMNIMPMSKGQTK